MGCLTSSSRSAVVKAPTGPSPRSIFVCFTHPRRPSGLTPKSLATSVTVFSDDNAKATASRLNSAVYRLLVLLFMLTTCDRFLRDHPSQYQAVQPTGGTSKTVTPDLGTGPDQHQHTKDSLSLTPPSQTRETALRCFAPETAFGGLRPSASLRVLERCALKYRTGSLRSALCRSPPVTARGGGRSLTYKASKPRISEGKRRRHVRAERNSFLRRP